MNLEAVLARLPKETVDMPQLVVISVKCENPRHVSRTRLVGRLERSFSALEEALKYCQKPERMVVGNCPGTVDVRRRDGPDKPWERELIVGNETEEA